MLEYIQGMREGQATSERGGYWNNYAMGQGVLRGQATCERGGYK